MKTNKERLRDFFARLDSLNYIKPEQIPNIDLYMEMLIDQIREDYPVDHSKKKKS